MTMEDVYNMDETGLFYCAQPNKTLSARKSLWVQNSKGWSHFCSCCNTTCIDKLKPVIIYKSLRSRCFGSWLPRYYVWWFANQMAWMASNVLESWMMSLNVYFNLKSGRYFWLWTILLLFFLSMLVGMNHLVINLLQSSNIDIASISHNVTSAVQPLD